MSEITNVVLRKHLAELDVGPTTEFPVYFAGEERLAQIYAWINKHRTYLTFDKPTDDCVFIRINREVYVNGAADPSAIYSEPLNSSSVELQINSVIHYADQSLSHLGTLQARGIYVTLTHNLGRCLMRIYVNSDATVHPRQVQATA